MANTNYLKKRMLLSFIKMLLIIIVVFGFIWFFTAWLEDYVGPTTMLLITIILNVTAVAVLTYYGKLSSAKEAKESLNTLHCEFILEPLEMATALYSLETSPENYPRRMETVKHQLNFIESRIDIVRKNMHYKNNIDYFYLIKQANELHPTSPSFLQDVENFKQSVKKEFNYT